MRLAVLAACLLVSSCASRKPPEDLVSRVHGFDLSKPYAPSGYDFLKPAVGQRSIVQLGESIRVTAEFPKARLRLVQFLHEEMGFDVLAFEGSAVEAWLAQETIYQSKDLPPPAVAEKAARLMLLDLWQTQPMYDVIEYAVRAQRTVNPLYLAVFDLQPGKAAALLDTLRRYDSSVSQSDFDAWKSLLQGMLACETPPPAESPLPAIETWMQSAANKVAASRPEAHVNALRLIPEFLRARIRYCQETRNAGDRRNADQAVRSRLNASHVFALRDRVSKNRKIMLWAHHSEVHHNSSGWSGSSLGQHLMLSSPDQIYTIGLFAGRGTTFDAAGLEGGTWTGKLPRPIRDAAEFRTESILAELSAGDFFIDLSAMLTPPEDWAPPNWMRIETGRKVPANLTKDFHGAVFIQEIHAPDLFIFPAILRPFLKWGGWLYQHWLISIAAVSLVAAVVFRIGRAVYGRKKRMAAGA